MGKCRGKYIRCGNQGSRTKPCVLKNNNGGNLGYLQVLVLEYALGVADTFSPSEVVVYVREKYGLVLDRRRVYDAVKRLVRRGYLVKVRRGVYRLSPRIDLCLCDLEELVTSSMCSGGGQGHRLSGGLVRVHCVGCGGVLGFYRVVLFGWCLLGFVVRGVEEYLRELGFGRGYLVRVRRGVWGLVRRVVGGVGVFGVHGFYGRGGFRASPLVPVSSACGLRGGLEIGVDYVVDSSVSLPKMHLKIYTTPENPYVGGEEKSGRGEEGSSSSSGPTK